MKAADFRRAALDLPETEEHQHHGRPDFRVRNKIFATLDEGEGCGVVKLPADEQAAVLAASPEVYSAAGGWGKYGWTNVRLDRADGAEVTELVVEAWCAVAPKRLVQAFEAAGRRG
jgi:hypothetical protein